VPQVRANPQGTEKISSMRPQPKTQARGGATGVLVEFNGKQEDKGRENQTLLKKKGNTTEPPVTKEVTAAISRNKRKIGYGLGLGEKGVGEVLQVQTLNVIPIEGN